MANSFSKSLRINIFCPTSADADRILFEEGQGRYRQAQLLSARGRSIQAITRRWLATDGSPNFGDVKAEDLISEFGASPNVRSRESIEVIGTIAS